MTIAVVPSPLPADDAGAVRALAAAASEHDGVAPLNEHALLHLHRSVGGDRHVLARDAAGSVVGYAFLDGREPAAEVVVAPTARRQGIGSAILEQLRVLTGGDLLVWAHGALPGAAPLAARAGLAPVRELFRMRRDGSTAAALPEPVLPEGVSVRTFVPGTDDEAWLAVNAAAFADHPEQGSWGADDLADRLAQPWFDQAGFFLAEGSGGLAGFHWTKVHDADPPHGEVYVVGVDPAYQGTGLGKALTVIGVRHLHAMGLRTVELYVDGANTAARRLYEKLGFEVAAVDVQYRA